MRKGVAIVLLACVSLLTGWTRSQSTCCSVGPGDCTFGDEPGFSWCDWENDGNWIKAQWEERGDRIPYLPKSKAIGRLTSRVTCPTRGNLTFYFLFIQQNYDLTVYVVDSISSSETAIWTRSSGHGTVHVTVTSNNNFVILFEGKQRPGTTSSSSSDRQALYVDDIFFVQDESYTPPSPSISRTTVITASTTTTTTAASENVESASQCLSFSHVAHIIGHAVSVVIIIALCIALVIMCRKVRARDPQNSIEAPGILLQSFNDQAARSKSVSLPPVRATGSPKPDHSKTTRTGAKTTQQASSSSRANKNQPAKASPGASSYPAGALKHPPGASPSPARGRKLPPIPQSQDASKTPFYQNTASTGSALEAPEENAYYTTATPDGYERASAIRSAQENKEGNYTGLAKN